MYAVLLFCWFAQYCSRLVVGISELGQWRPLQINNFQIYHSRLYNCCLPSAETSKQQNGRTARHFWTAVCKTNLCPEPETPAKKRPLFIVSLSRHCRRIPLGYCSDIVVLFRYCRNNSSNSWLFISTLSGKRALSLLYANKDIHNSFGGRSIQFSIELARSQITDSVWIAWTFSSIVADLVKIIVIMK